MMNLPEEETALLIKLAPALNQRLGPLVVWAFTASFMADGWWISRMDYTLEGEDQTKTMKGLLMEGRTPTFGIVNTPEIRTMNYMRPRIFRERPSIAILREGLILLELESPDPGERYA
jgi:hypothetical protein